MTEREHELWHSLKQCQRVLAELTGGDVSTSSAVMWAQCVEADAKARRVLMLCADEKDLHDIHDAQARMEGNDLLHAKSMGIDVDAIDAEACRRAHEARVLGLDTDIKMGR